MISYCVKFPYLTVLNDSFTWKILASNVVGPTPVNLPTASKEIYIRTMIMVGSVYYAVSFYLLRQELAGYTKRYMGALANGNDCQFTIVGTENSVRLNDAKLNGTDYTNSANTAIFYR